MIASILKRANVAALVALLSAAPMQVFASDSPGPLTVHADQSGPVINRDIKVPVARWPGGCFADNYHWRNGIGPADRRKVTLNSILGGVTEPNNFGADEFMDFAQQIEAEAYVSVNVGSGIPRRSSRMDANSCAQGQVAVL